MLISSRENPLIKEAAALISDKKVRKNTGLFVVEGARLCGEAAKSTASIERVFITEEAEKRYENYVKELLSAAKETYYITESVAGKISDTKNPQGVFAVCRFREKPVDFESDGLFVLLSELQDPGNIGTILRTAEAMNAKGVLLCASAELFSPKVLRSTMGCLFRLPVMVFDTTAEALDLLREHGIRTYAAALSSRAVMLPNVRFAKKSCVLIGNEGNGLSIETLACCDETVMIPMPGRAESLNAASAAAIMIYCAGIQLSQEVK